MAVASLGDPSEFAFPSAGVFRWCESEVAHQLLRVVEASDIAELGNERRRGDEANSPECLDRDDNRLHAPAVNLVLELGLESPEPIMTLADGTDILLEDDLLGWSGQGTVPSQRK